jgi:hypothetical protein
MIKYFLFLIHLGSIVHNCDVFQTRRTCECKAVYTYASDGQSDLTNARTLFNLPSYDDCGINLGCERLDCAQKCLNKVRETLGGRADYITLSGIHKTCDLITAPNKPTVLASNSIRVWASWKYSTCRSGIEPVVQDVCCNRKCNCRLLTQKVSSDKNDADLSPLVDLTSSLPARDGSSYDCSLNLVNTCQDECMNVIGNYFSNNDIKKPNPLKLNLNMFTNDRYASDRVCTMLNEVVNKPGVDVYAQVDIVVDANRYVNLGRLCCRRECKCEYVFVNATTNNQSRPNYDIALVDPYQSLGYECANEISDCLTACRRSAFNLISLTNASFKLDETLSELDVFKGNNVYKKYICELINNDSPSEIYGFNVYIKYSAYGAQVALNKYPYKEDLHLGRICCQKTLGGVVGINRCNRTDP